MKSKHLEIILAFALVVVVVSAFATTWNRSYPLPLGPLGMSADGRIICAVYSVYHPLISTNSGQTWSFSTNSPVGSPSFDGVAISANGAVIIAALSTNVYISTNYGGTWAKTGVPLGAPNVACSADGTKLIAGSASGSIYYSTNSGSNWSTSSVPITNLISVASSADGSRMAGIANGGQLYFSTNFGLAWTATNLPSMSWTSVCLSSDANWVGATGEGTYISSNAGVSWNSNNLNGHAIACSANGMTWMVAGSQVYTSSDGGVTWQTNLSQSTWWSGAVSADGCEFMVLGGSIWIGRNTPSPQLSIQPADQSVNLSWLIPSTNFVLQQSSDLTTTNWTDVSNSQVLNFTNLQQQVSVPSSSTNSFFRLIAR